MRSNLCEHGVCRHEVCAWRCVLGVAEDVSVGKAVAAAFLLDVVLLLLFHQLT